MEISKFLKMKKLNRLNLAHLSKADLEARQMSALKGGACCGCGCHYANSGGATTGANGNANVAHGYSSRGGNAACVLSGIGWFISTC
jgi:natural product precursor